jgi:hypothetical protein
MLRACYATSDAAATGLPAPCAHPLLGQLASGPDSLPEHGPTEHGAHGHDTPVRIEVVESTGVVAKPRLSPHQAGGASIFAH